MRRIFVDAPVSALSSLVAIHVQSHPAKRTSADDYFVLGVSSEFGLEPRSDYSDGKLGFRAECRGPGPQLHRKKLRRRELLVRFGAGVAFANDAHAALYPGTQ